MTVDDLWLGQGLLSVARAIERHVGCREMRRVDRVRRRKVSDIMEKYRGGRTGGVNRALTGDRHLLRYHSHTGPAAEAMASLSATAALVKLSTG